MSPRPYRSVQRQAATEQTRARILTAARQLLTAKEGLAGFSIDAVARQAGVARMTVYYQFGSKNGLLEAVFDDLAARAQLGERLAAAFQRPDALDTLDGFIAAFSHFWFSDRLLIPRLQGLAALDPDFEQARRARGGRRRHGCQVVVRRLVEQRGQPDPESVDEAVDILLMLTSFETFDWLAGTTRGVEEVTALVRRLARAALGLNDR